MSSPSVTNIKLVVSIDAECTGEEQPFLDQVVARIAQDVDRSLKFSARNDKFFGSKQAGIKPTIRFVEVVVPY
jgi:hypothetical protein